MLPLDQLDLSAFVLVAVYAVVIDDHFAVDEQLGAIIGTNDKFVFAVFGAFNLTLENEGEVFVGFSQGYVEEPGGDGSGFLGFERGEVRHFAPTTVVVIVGEVGDGVGQSRDYHHAIHELEVSWEGADVGVIPFFLRSGEVDDLGLLGLDHASAVQQAGVTCGLPVLFHTFVTEFDHGIDEFLTLVFPFGFARGADDQVVGKVIGIIEDQLDLGVGFYAK